MMILSRLCLALALLCVMALPARAQALAEATQLPPQKLQIIGQGVVSEILKPDLIRLDTGAIFVLDNIRVPALYADQALAWLDANLLSKHVVLYASPDLGDAARDRMGNSFAHGVISGDTARWVQGEMVANGLAWADSTATNRSLITELLALEDKARTASLGFWSSPGMAVRKIEDIGTARNQFMVVTGSAVETADKKSVFFANYGKDWKTDFTLSLTKQNSRNFPSGFHMDMLKDKPVRVRGWVFEKNGPMIELTHPEQIEFLPDSAEKQQPQTPAANAGEAAAQ